MFPNKLQHDDTLASLLQKYNEMVDYLREIRLVPGSGIRINKHSAGTTIESTATATGGVSIPPDQWNISAIESEDHIDVTVRVQRAEDPNDYTLMFRGSRYSVVNKTFRITRADLERGSIALVIVKRINNKRYIDFTLAMTRRSHRNIYDDFSSGIFYLGSIWLNNGTVATTINSKSVFEWEDGYSGNGLFTADLAFTDIPDAGSTFTDFLDTAKQVLAVSQIFPMYVNDMLIDRTGWPDSGDYSDLYTVFDISPEQIGNNPQCLWWLADYGPTGSSGVPIPQNCRFELNRYSASALPNATGLIRLSVAYISDASINGNIRMIYRYHDSHSGGLKPQHTPSNFPMLYINPYGKDFAAGGSGALYLDLTAQKLKCSITCFINGIWNGDSQLSLAAPFNAFTYGGNLKVCIRFNYSTRQWSKPWFALGGSALTPVPDFSGTLYEKTIAYIEYNSETQRPVIRAQNFSPIIDFTSEREYFTDFQTRISALETRVTNLENAH